MSISPSRPQLGRSTPWADARRATTRTSRPSSPGLPARSAGRVWRRCRGARGGTGRGGSQRVDRLDRGEAPSGTIRSVYAYTLATARWRRLRDLPTPRHGLGVAAIGTRVYAIAGGRSPASRSATPTSTSTSREGSHHQRHRGCRRIVKREQTGGDGRSTRRPAGLHGGDQRRRAGGEAGGCDRDRRHGLPRRAGAVQVQLARRGGSRPGLRVRRPGALDGLHRLPGTRVRRSSLRRMHARAGTPDGVLNHTVSGSEWRTLTFNGVEVGEIGINAALCGHWGLPGGARHGRPRHLRRGPGLLGDGLTTSPSRRDGPLRRRNLAPKRGRELIEEGARKALKDVDAVPPYDPGRAVRDPGRLPPQRRRRRLPLEAGGRDRRAARARLPRGRLVVGLRQFSLLAGCGSSKPMEQATTSSRRSATRSTAGSPGYDPDPRQRDNLGFGADDRSQWEYWAAKSTPSCGPELRRLRRTHRSDRRGLEECAKDARVADRAGRESTHRAGRPVRPAADNLRAWCSRARRSGSGRDRRAAALEQRLPEGRPEDPAPERADPRTRRATRGVARAAVLRGRSGPRPAGPDEGGNGRRTATIRRRGGTGCWGSRRPGRRCHRLKPGSRRRTPPDRLPSVHSLRPKEVAQRRRRLLTASGAGRSSKSTSSARCARRCPGPPRPTSACQGEKNLARFNRLDASPRRPVRPACPRRPRARAGRRRAPGRVRLYTARGEAQAELAGGFAMPPNGASCPQSATGSRHADRPAIVQAVLPRKTKFSRLAASDHGGTVEQVVAANVDVVFLVAGSTVT